MALTPTKPIPLGFPAPDFTLPDTITGEEKSLQELKSDKATVVMFICNHCPYVKHVIHGIIDLANDYIPKDVSFVAISSNDVENYPADSPENMEAWAKELNFPFPYLFDETQEVAKAYSAACTPDFSIFDGAMKCVYRGQLDESRPGNHFPVTGEDIRQALNAILAGKPVSQEQKPSVGCNIKWKS